MKLARRQFLHLAAGATALPAVSRIAWAQTYPARPVRIVVGLTAGSASDIVARLVGQWLSERLGQQFIVENRPGAGTNIAAEAVVRSVPDGYTLLLAASPNAINASLYDKLSFNFIRDIAPVAAISREPNVIVVNPSLPTRTVPELIAYAKANPGMINMASAGNGTTSHLAGELFKMMTGVNMVHVPYRGGGPALTDLLAGLVQVFFPPMVVPVGQIRAGKLRALAVTTATTRRPTQLSPTSRSKHGWLNQVALCFQARLRTLAISLPRKPRSGARWSGRQTSSRSRNSHETARVHRAARRRGCRLAARGPAAADRANAARRRAHERGCGRYGRTGSHRCVPQGWLR